MLAGIGFVCISLSAQQQIKTKRCGPATIVVFRTFNLISSSLSYKLYAGDSLLGRINPHDVFIITTYDSTFSLSAATKAPSLNTSRKSRFTKIKKINYSFSIKSGEIYLIKCDFLNQEVFNYPRQPTIRLLKGLEEAKYLKRPFIRKKVKTHLYNSWAGKNI
jgi:hypothetical protein